MADTFERLQSAADCGLTSWMTFSEIFEFSRNTVRKPVCQHAPENNG
ncbi:hypothetical protein CPter91_3498 [Collimonas pratensis]|uniref:Uncharacterized protein n=1 Tax=Collimonas pratensis TaxID=279113 RepID=A0A127Q713_9BURK|nr:hypothetical protein CPter91_3498 [Collimonas pratensis]